MKISIVTPSYNQGAFIAQALDSVLAQGYPQIEHIVLDNCSTDGTAHVLAEQTHLKVICEPDKGQSDALNKGFKMAAGDIAGWLNADDRYLPGCFERVAQFFLQHPEVDVLYGDYRLIDAQGKVLRTKQEFPFDLFTLKYHHVLCIPSTTCFFRRRIFDQGNFLDETYHYAMDYEFFLRLALKGYHFAHIPVVMADFRWHADAKSSRQTGLQLQEREQALVTHDPFLRSIPGAHRTLVRTAFMLFSRFKRVVIRLFL
ncbi:MAG: glycosyltransferase [Candidatus Omnitrophica bacterium]|nr:glycosyltransferase [Candidatus Omnitrophota bacterium]